MGGSFACCCALSGNGHATAARCAADKCDELAPSHVAVAHGSAPQCGSKHSTSGHGGMECRMSLKGHSRRF